MKVKALVDFYDIEAKVNRAKGEVFDADDERIAQLNACGTEQGGKPLVAEVVEVKAPKRKAAE